MAFPAPNVSAPDFSTQQILIIFGKNVNFAAVSRNVNLISLHLFWEKHVNSQR